MPQTLHEWVKRHEIDTRTREGVTTADQERIKDLERAVKELRRANEIPKLASALVTLAKLASTQSSPTCPEPMTERGFALSTD